MRCARGFTLLELLVAISIFAIVSAMAYGALTQMLRSRDQVETERNFWRALAVTFWRINDDLGQARLRDVRDVDGARVPSFRGQPVDPRATALPSLEFTRGGVDAFDVGARSDLQRVAYRVVDGKLERLTWPVLDRAPDTKPVASALIGDIKDVEFVFYADAKQRFPVWPVPTQGGVTTPAQDTLPRAVEITITFAHRGSFSRLFLVGG